MSAGTRLDRVDALRALALLPVLVVNMGSYRVTHIDLPMLWPQPEGSALAWVLTLLSTALLQGKGITLLTFLVGYTLTLGSDPARRAHRLLLLGLLHGLLLYYGDILSSYALAALMALRHRRAPLRELVRRAKGWLGLGLLLMGLLSLPWGETPAQVEWSGLISGGSAWGWWAANSELYGSLLLSLPLTLPVLYSLVLMGLAAGRLRLLSHPRWRPVWQRLARAALPMLGLNLAMALAVLSGKLGDGFLFIVLVALFTVPSWVAWFLLRPALPARWLVLAGRSTLTIYLGGSLITVSLFSAAGWNWAAGSVASAGVAVLAWAGLASAGAAAARRGKRLPLEAWMARR